MSALLLRTIACIAMLMDHIGYYNGNMALRAIGRVAFPIFVYLIVNGYKHTSCRWKYALRLAVFAMISQIPFSLFCTGRWNWHNGNVFFTLLIALLCVWATDILQKGKICVWVCWIPTVAVCLLYQLGALVSDYGARGTVLAISFYFLDGKKMWKLVLMSLSSFMLVFYDQLAELLWTFLSVGTLSLPRMDQWIWWQLYSLFSLPLIFMYNGEKGSMPGRTWSVKLLQYGFYLFYPLHMLVIWLVYVS